MKRIFNMPKLNVVHFDREHVLIASAGETLKTNMETAQPGVMTKKVDWNASGQTFDFTF